MATRTFSQACFVPPAAPTSTSKGPLIFMPPPSTVSTQSGSNSLHENKKTKESNLALSARKKAASSGSSAGTSSSKKVQVKLLRHVAGTGQAGEIVMVSPAFYNNKLRPGKLAEQISDEKVVQEQQRKQELQKEIMEQATSLRSKLAQQDDGEFVLVMWAKAGPTGQLFGGIGAKAILDELKRQVPDPYWDNPSVQKLIRVDSLLSLEIESEDGSNPRRIPRKSFSVGPDKTLNCC
ncbi:hypothetical protein ACA910_000489 [Epithemia clementina (nom. ined.)]